MAKGFSISVDLSEEIAFLDALGEDVKTVLRPAAQAGAQVFYEEALRKVPVATDVVVRKGKVIPPGALKASIYQAYSRDNSSPTRATYHISWNASKAPHGHLIENGHWTKKVGKYGPLKPHWVPAHSFIRASYESAGQRAEAAVDAKVDEALTKAMGRLV